MEENFTEYDQIRIDDTLYSTKLTKAYKSRKVYVEPDIKKVFSKIPGTIIEIKIAEGKKVKKGETVLFLDSMKMKNLINAPISGTIAKIHVTKGLSVSKNALLFEMK